MPGSMIALRYRMSPVDAFHGKLSSLENWDGKDTDLVSVFEGIGKWNHRHDG